MQSNKLSITLTIDLIISIFGALYYILPSISAQYDFQLTIILGFVYLIVISIQNGYKIKFEIIKYILLFALIALLYTLLTETSTIASSVSNSGLKRFFGKFYQIYMMFLPVLFFHRMNSEKNKTNRRIVLAVSYVLYLYVMVTTIRELAINANITRKWSQFGETILRNIANYYFVCSVPFTTLLSWDILKRIRNNIIKGVILALVVFQFYFLIVSQYTLAVIVCVCGFAYEYIKKSKGNRKNIIGILFGLVLFFTSPWIIRFAATHVPSKQMAIRLNEIYYFLTAADTTGYNLNGRFALYWNSIVAFIKSPLWGNRHLDFDGHATFLTVFSDLGLLGGIPYIYLYRISRNKVRALLGEADEMFKPHFFMLIFMGLTNPIHAALPLMFASWFVVPLTIIEITESYNNSALFNKDLKPENTVQ